MRVLFLVATVVCACWGASVPTVRHYDPNEENVDYKRFVHQKNSLGEIVLTDLAAGEIEAYAKPKDVTYKLRTRSNINDPISLTGDVNELDNSPFNKNRRTLFITHGWTDSADGELNQLVAPAALKVEDLNVFSVDWNPVARKNYITAKNAVTDIGEILGAYINNIIDKYGIRGSQIILIGHSLGAHVSGNAGAVTKERVDHIIGLDPAAPLFSVSKTSNRLDPSDAQYVQILHTNGRLLGFSTSIGHADFFPNGGEVQAGCGLDLIGTCSHSRSYEFLAEAIEHGSQFTATQCGRYKDFTAGKCDGNRQVKMAELDIDKSIIGDFYLKTNTKPPFAQG